MFIGGLPDSPHQPRFGQTFDVAEMFYVQLFVCRISATYGVVVQCSSLSMKLMGVSVFFFGIDDNLISFIFLELSNVHVDRGIRSVF